MSNHLMSGHISSSRQGRSENSPAIHRRERQIAKRSPVGTAETRSKQGFSRPYGTGIFPRFPSDKSLGYFQLSLRDSSEKCPDIKNNYLKLLGLLILLAIPAFAQKDSAETAPKGLLKIPVWVEENEEKFWLDGNRQAFKVFVEEKETPLKSFQTPRSSTILLIVFDTVADLARVDQARTALNKAIKTLGQNYWIGLLKAQDGLSVLLEPTANRTDLMEKIQAIQVNGKAGLLDTLEPVSKLAAGMMQKANVRVAVLYVTDSGIANYRADYLNPVVNSSDSGDLSRRFSDRAVQEQMSRQTDALSQFTAPIFVLHLSYRTDSLNLAYQSGLERIAAASGGLTLFSRAVDDVDSLLETLLKRIQSSYLLGVDQPAAKRRTVKFRVEAKKADGQIPGKLIHREQINIPKK